MRVPYEKHTLRQSLSSSRQLFPCICGFVSKKEGFKLLSSISLESPRHISRTIHSFKMRKLFIILSAFICGAFALRLQISTLPRFSRNSVKHSKSAMPSALFSSSVDDVSVPLHQFCGHLIFILYPRRLPC